MSSKRDIAMLLAIALVCVLPLGKAFSGERLSETSLEKLRQKLNTKSFKSSRQELGKMPKEILCRDLLKIAKSRESSTVLHRILVVWKDAALPIDGLRDNISLFAGADADEGVIVELMKTFADLGKDSDFELIAPFLNSENENIRIHALRASARLATQDNISIIKNTIDSKRSKLSAEQIKNDYTFREAEKAIQKIRERATSKSLVREVDVPDTSSGARLLETLSSAILHRNYSVFRACLGGEAGNEYPPTDENDKRYKAESLQKAKKEFSKRYEGATLQSLELKKGENGQPVGILRFTKSKGDAQKALTVTLTLSKAELGWRATKVTVEEKDAPKREKP